MQLDSNITQKVVCLFVHVNFLNNNNNNNNYYYYYIIALFSIPCSKNKYVIPGKINLWGKKGKLSHYDKKSQEIIPDVMASLRLTSTSPKRVQISGTTLTQRRRSCYSVALLVIDNPADTDRVSYEARKLVQNTLQHLHIKRVATYCAQVGCTVYEVSLQATSTSPSIEVQCVAL